VGPADTAPETAFVRGYWSIDLEILHTTARDQLSGFVAELRSALADLEALED
jgi:hypothetical protein